MKFFIPWQQGGKINCLPLHSWAEIRPKQKYQVRSQKHDYTKLECPKTVCKKKKRMTQALPSRFHFKTQKQHSYTCVYSHMILIISCTGKSSPTSWLCTVIRSFACMCPDVNLSNIRRCERSATSFERTFKGPFT